MSTTFCTFVRGVELKLVVKHFTDLFLIPLNRSEEDSQLFYNESQLYSIGIYGDPNFENDQGIDFSNYPVVVSLTRYAIHPYTESIEQCLQDMSVLFAKALVHKFNCKTLVVKDLQVIIAVFTPETLNDPF